MDSYSTNEGVHFTFFHHSPRIKFFFDSAQYHTARSQYFFILNFEYLCENETKFEFFFTHWSVAQAGSNDEKN